ncbi:protein draper isoform X2 [Eurytemora carolleeae]|nr:protein draper isoform X2 [Eurytemora carolleeae]XP_023334132.1 protein draper isoform X2 [Eurytemora carolleeae]|eukprot:XP_023334131.1 protein draper-like isoform X2 [Eurytemora affinis]
MENVFEIRKVLTAIIPLILSVQRVQMNKVDEVCYIKDVVTTPTNVSHLVPIKTIEQEWCWSWSLRCEIEKTTWKTEITVENITRVVNQPTCCPGYIGQVGNCTPVCSTPCVHGACVSSETCDCEAGYSGGSCQEIGCPPNKWGKGCQMNCKCTAPGSSCDPLSGLCICPPGFQGPNCLDKCSPGSYGLGCTGKNNCSTGYSTHYITGECLPCPSGSYGSNCSSSCSCSQNGTALCSHIEGTCYCSANYFGPLCETYCPFGYQDGTCLSMNGTECECPNDLYICDLLLGCICRQDIDCGIEEPDQQVEIGLLTEGTGHSRIIIAVCGVLGFGLFVLILMVIYYKRRIQRLRSDLENRQGITNMFPDADVFNPEPLPEIPQLSMPEMPLNNLDSSTSSNKGIDNPLYIVNNRNPEKNINRSQSRNSDSSSPFPEKPQNQDEESVYQEPGDILNRWSLINDFKDKYGKNFEEFEDDSTYSHLDHSRSNNHISPRYDPARK